MSQIPLPLVLGKHSRFDTFVAGENSTLVTHLRALGSGRASEVIWIWGPAGCGKSHLLQATCAYADRPRAMFLPLRDVQSAGADALLGLETLDVVALDDVDAVSGSTEWDRALFRLYNQLQAAGGCLILTARRAPAGTAFSLADLASRAAGAVVYQLRVLDDEQLLQAVQLHADSRGLDLPESAARYLLTRVSREMGVICRWLDDLDTASLIAKRRLTVPFIRAALAERSESGS
jgi:DnaA family protein